LQKVGEVVAVIEVAGDSTEAAPVKEEATIEEEVEEPIAQIQQQVFAAKETVAAPVQDFSNSERFYSPLVKNIAKEEGISTAELDTIPGTGKEGRVTKNDILAFIENRGLNGGAPAQEAKEETSKPVEVKETPKSAAISPMQKLVETKLFRYHVWAN